MRALPAAAFLAVAVLAPSCQAQDFLGGLARSVGASAAQALVDRAVTAATSPSQPPAQGAAPARAAATAIRQTPALPLRTESGLLYNEEGDLVFEWRGRSASPFEGKVHWRNAAYCVALSDLVDIHVAEWTALAAKGGHPYTGDTVEEARESRRVGQDAHWRRFGLLRLRIDRPRANNHEAVFEAEVTRQIAELRQRDWSARFAWQNAEAQCNSLSFNVRSLFDNMQNRRGMGSRRADGERYTGPL